MRALIFDSGMGGLTVAAEIRKAMPELAMDYVADDAFRPYGEKTENQLRARLPGLLGTLEIMLEPDIIVLACNTASVTALAEIRQEVKAPVVGVVPAIKPAAGLSENGIIAVLGTPGTVRRAYVDDLIREFAHGVDVRRLGSVNLVKWAEDKMAGKELDLSAIKSEVSPLFPDGQPVPDVLVMACTHFPLLAGELAATCPQGVQFIDSGEAIARRVVSLLTDANIRQPGDEDRVFLIADSENSDLPQVRRQAFKSHGFKSILALPA